MKLITTMGFVLLALLAGTSVSDSAAVSGELPKCVSLRTDRFTGLSVMEVKPHNAYKNAGITSLMFDITFQWFFTANESSSTRPDSLTFVIVRAAGVRRGVSTDRADWRFPLESAHLLNSVVDGVRLNPIQMTYLRGEQAATYLGEQGLSNADKWIAPEVLHAKVPTGLFLNMVDAQSTECRVDGLEFLLTHKSHGFLARYQCFAEYLRGLPTSEKRP